ncbi:MAG: hypothetical protein GXO39_05105 [Thermotogae bacterium]|nr:hypothetical protein [Thermotogota bacterium]
MWYLLVEPLVFNRWSGEAGATVLDTTYGFHLRLRGEWLISTGGVVLFFSTPFVFPEGRRFSLSDAEVGFGVPFSELNRLYVSGIFPAGVLSSKYPGLKVEFLRKFKGDSTYGVYAEAEWYFVAASDDLEHSFYNKPIDRHGTRHVSLEGAFIKNVGETGFLKFSIPLDYAQSLGQFWAGIRVGGGLFPFLEFDLSVWPMKPRPYLVSVRVLALIPSAQDL